MIRPADERFYQILDMSNAKDNERSQSKQQKSEQPWFSHGIASSPLPRLFPSLTLLDGIDNRRELVIHQDNIRCFTGH